MALQTGELGGVTAPLRCGMSRDAILSIGNWNWNVRKKEFGMCEFFEELETASSRSTSLDPQVFVPGIHSPHRVLGKFQEGALAETLEGISPSRESSSGVLVLLFSI